MIAVFDGMQSDYCNFLPMGWCREEVTNYLRCAGQEATAYLDDAGLIVVNIYGVRSLHDNRPEPPDVPTPAVADTMQLLLEVFVEMVESVMGWDGTDIEIFPNIGTHQLGLDIRGGTRLTQNFYSTGADGFDIEGMRGAVTGIPLQWLSSIPVMSFLLLLPRIWACLERIPELVSAYQKRGYKFRRHPGNMGMLSPWYVAAKKIMIPLWEVTCCREEFWQFLSLLDTMDKGGEYNDIIRRRLIDPPGYVDGFCSWLLHMKDNCNEFERYGHASFSVYRGLREHGPYYYLTAANPLTPA